MYTQKRLIAISLVLYVVSLSLPAVGGQLGIMVMITGVAFGWWGLLVGIIPGVAAYANVFYLWSVFRLLEGRQPVAAMTICMLISGFTLLLPIMSLMYGHQYASVGLGVFLWFAALWLLWLTVMTDNTPEALRQSFKKWAKTCAAVTLALFAFGRWQYAAANAQQREQYFPFGTVFAFMLPSSLPYIAPPQSLPEPNNGTAEWLGGLEISQDNSLILVSGSLKEYTPPKRFIYQGYLIQEYFHEDGILSIIPAPAPADYRYGYRPAKEGEQGEQIQFIQKADGQTVWQAPVKADGSGQYPEYNKEIKRLWQPPLHTEIAAGFKANPVQTFTESCPIEPYRAPFKLHEPLQIDGKIYSDKYRSPVAKSRILCNSEYILWLNAPEYQDYNGRVDISAVLIRRSDMLPVEKFNTSREKGWTNYDELKQASEQPQAWLAGIGRMETRRRDENGYGYEDYELVVHSGNGEWVLN